MRFVVCVLLVASFAHADQWVSPTVQTVKSPNGKVTATITPSKDGKSAATAVIGKTKITLKSDWMPVDSVVFDDGTLLTFDNWHSLGHGDVATFYERNGKVRWKKTLVQLLGKHAEGAQRSVSSIWWRHTPIEWNLASDGKSGTVTLFDEHQVRIEIKDGASTIVPVDNLPDIPARLVNRARALANRDGQEAAAAALLERAILKEPTNFEALGLYVDVLQRSNDHVRVIATLERVSPKWGSQDGHNVANVSIGWAKSLQALSKTSEAERVLRLAVTAAPTYPNPAVALAKLLFDQKRSKEADRVLDEFVARLLKQPYLDTFGLGTAAELYKQRKEHEKALALYLKGYKQTEVTNQFLYAELAELHEEMGNDADALRVHEQLLAHFVKMGSAFDMYIKQTREHIARLRAKKKP